MRRLLMLFVGFLASAFMFAEGVDKAQALKKAQKFMPGKNFQEVKSVSKARGDASGDAFYVFNAEKNGGFVIVSGDDRTVPILGYSRTGSIDMEKMPENMKWWLEGYARQIEALRSGSLLPSAQSKTTSPKAVIPEMIKTSWGQGAPYNLMCPDENYYDSGDPGYDPTKLCLTGCVATAMAQILYYYQWPGACSTIGEYSVGDYDEYGNYTEKGSIKAIPPATFDWTKLKTSYNANETDDAAQEVAKLMRYCGQAVGMAYGSEGSGAYLAPSVLASVFNYSKNIRELSRDDYTTSQWEGIIYDELAANRPVLYCGYTKKDEGHQFIVDGYDGSGLFHINWGWGGFQDSYFVLSIADPDKPGAVATATEGSFQLGQYALIGVKPAEEGEVMFPSVTCSIYPEAVTIDTYSRDDASKDFKDVVLTGNVFASYMMKPSSDMTFEYGWALYQDDNFIKALDSKNGTVLATQWWWNYYNNDKTVSFGAGLTDGKYQLSQVYRLPGDTEWKRCGNYGVNSFVAEVSANSLTVRLADTDNSSFVVNNMSLVTEFPEVESPVELKANVTNNGESQRLLLNLWAKKEGTENWTSLKSVVFYLTPGKTDDISISYIPAEAGTYTLKVTDNTSEEALKTATVTVAGTETIIVDNVKYLCTPAYHLAKVIGYVGDAELLTSINILQIVKAGGVDCQVKVICDWAFNSLWNVKSLVIPQGVEMIGERAFCWMNNLTKLELPASLKSIGEGVIEGCSQLEAVISRINEPGQVAVNMRTFATSQWNNGVESFIPSSATLYVPAGTRAKYEAVPAWTQFAGIEEGELLEATVGVLKYSYPTGGTTATVIQDDSYTTLEEVTIPATVDIGGKNYAVKAIGTIAFQDCDNLTTVVLSEGLESIGKYAFLNSAISGITLPSTVKTIGEGAFEGCWNVNTLVIPLGVETIGDYAFGWMRSLTKLELPASLKSIGKNIISGDSQLAGVISRITDPSQVTIDNNSFTTNQWNESMGQSVISPSPATLYVPVGTRSNYEAIPAWTQFADIVEGELMVATVGVLKYSYTTGGTTATVIQDDSYKTLEEVTIPATVNIGGKTYAVKAIGNVAFQHCNNLTTVVLSEGLESIGNNAFQGISASEILFPNSLKTIGAHAFEDSWNVKTIVISEGVETVGEYAFSYMGSLTKLELPASLKSLGTLLITCNSQITSVISHIEDPSQVTIDKNTFSQSQWDVSMGQNVISPSPATLYVPVGAKTKYEAIPAWTQFAGIVEGELLEATDGVLRYSYLSGGTTATVIRDDSYQSLTEVNIPATIDIDGKTYNVTAIGNKAFEDCWNIKTVAISEGVETIGERAFCYMGNLTKLELPSTLKSIGKNIIAWDSQLTGVISRITDPSLVTIDNNSFTQSQWNGNTEIITPSSATLYVPVGTGSNYEAIPAWTQFAGILEGDLMEATVDGLRYSYTTGGTTATVIKDDSYQLLTSVTIPATVEIDTKTYNVTAIGKDAFRYCYMLESVELPNGLETIGNNAFQNTPVNGLLFPNSLKTIGAHAFEDCWNVKKVVIPEGVETVGEYAFSYMSSLTRIELPSSLTSLGYAVIDNNSMLTEVISNITDPFLIDSSVFGIYHRNQQTNTDYYTPSPYTLYVPAGTKSKYQAIEGWTMFASIEEGEPFDYMVGLLKFRCSPDSKTAILIQGDYSGITAVNIPANIYVEGAYYQVKAIGGKAFENCWQLTEVILPEGLVSISSQAFSCTAVSSINFPSTLKTIYNNAFWDCDGLETVKLPKGLETIGDFAFAECSNLQSLEIPSTVTSIGPGVIMYDNSLTSVKSNIHDPYAVEDNAFVLKDEWNETSNKRVLTPSPATLYVHPGKKEAYENTQGWKEFQIIEEQVVLGDANGDGNVDNDDVKAVEDYIMGNSPSDFIFDNADVKKDGKVNAADLVMIIDIIKNL